MSKNLLLIALCLVTSAASAAEAGKNLALGKTVLFAPAPDFDPPARGGTDATDLTDGRLCEKSPDLIYARRESVGWRYAGRVHLALDLGKQENIGGVSIRLQGGGPKPTTAFPVWVELVLSDDGATWRLAAEYSRWTPGDRDRYGIPAEGEASWVHTLTFADVNLHARWVGLMIYGGAFCASDELWVHEAPAGDRLGGIANLPVAAFSVTEPTMYFHKPVVSVPVNFNAPTPVGVIVPEDRKLWKATAIFDLPPGVRLVGGDVGGQSADRSAGRPLADGWRRYAFTAPARATSKNWGRVYLRTDWPDGQAGEIHYQLRWYGGGSALVSQPIRALRVRPAPQPKRLMTSLVWWGLAETMEWPDALEAFRTLGLNTLPVRARSVDLDDPKVMGTVHRFRQAGFRVINVDSPLHHMANVARRGGQTECFCRPADGPPTDVVCPSYRGPLYQAELDRIARETAQVRANILSCDIEMYGGAGRAAVRSCARCQEDFRRSGLKDRAEWQEAKGYEMWTDLADRVRSAARDAGAQPPLLYAWGFQPGEVYHGFWPFDRLYPRHVAGAEAVTYSQLAPAHIALVGDRIRAIRSKLPKSDVLPWLTPGDAGGFPGEAFIWAILECYANGAWGVQFWSGRVWDAESLGALADAIRIAAPVENVILDGRPVEGVTCEPAMRVSGMQRGDEMFLLIADYASPPSAPVRVTLPPGPARTVVDLQTGRTVAELPGGQRGFALTFDGQRARALHVRPF